MEIVKHGKIIITEDDITVTEFEVNGSSVHGFEVDILEWAIDRLKYELHKRGRWTTGGDNETK